MSRSKGVSMKKVESGRWSESDARVAIDAWRSSGQRLQTFARERGIGAWKLRWWAQKLGAAKGSPAKKRRSPDEIRFVPALVTSASMGEAVAVVVRLPDGIEVELRDARASAEEVGRLVAVLRRVGA
jgi:hypothetical protein